jgi:hypothetical protein
MKGLEVVEGALCSRLCGLRKGDYGVDYGLRDETRNGWFALEKYAE